MAAYLALGVLFLVIGVLAIKWFTVADAATLAKVVKWGGIAVAVVVVFFLIVTRQFGVLMMTAVIGSMLMRSARGGLFRRFKPTPSPGQASAVDTDYLHMTLDHDSGAMNGRILSGRHAGASLDDLSLDQLMGLLAECYRADPPSVPLIETYLDRRFADWREQTGGAEDAAGGAAPSAMSQEEARAILGVEADATTDDIKDAHRRLMVRLHPDQGGSNYLAAQINRAKDALLGE